LPIVDQAGQTGATGVMADSTRREQQQMNPAHRQAMKRKLDAALMDVVTRSLRAIQAQIEGGTNTQPEIVRRLAIDENIEVRATAQRDPNEPRGRPRLT
jgi:hypothetical protein